jgi:methyl-accepting chemotaxis protein
MIFWQKVKENFQNYKLQDWIMAGDFLPVFLSFISAGLVYFQGVKSLEIQERKVEKLHERRGRVKDLAYSISAMQQTFRGYLISKNQQELKEYEEWDTNFYELSERLRNEIVAPEQRKNLNVIIEVGDKLNEFNRRLISYMELGKPEKATEAFVTGEVEALSNNVDELVNEFQAIEEKELQAEEVVLKDAIMFLTVVVFGAAIAAAIIAIALGGLISKAIGDRMRGETTAIASSSSEIAATIVQQERVSVQQATSVNQVTSSIDELNASFQKVTEQTQTTARDANEALKLAGAGGDAVNLTLEGMSALRNTVEAIASQSDLLNDKSSEINKIVALVGELSSQINMLALNASIEAVRAGENGKGFGVVASEIRRLADRSQEYTGSINNLIKELQKAIAQTATATGEGTLKVEEGMKIVSEMASAFTGVSEAINNVDLSNKQIALNAKQQLAAIEQIAQGMNAINQGAQENASGVSQVKIGIQRLDSALQNLIALYQ